MPGRYPSYEIPTSAEIEEALSCADGLVAWFEAHPGYRPGVDAYPPRCG